VIRSGGGTGYGRPSIRMYRTHVRTSVLIGFNSQRDVNRRRRGEAVRCAAIQYSL
jgi:hypothetical protein